MKFKNLHQFLRQEVNRGELCTELAKLIVDISISGKLLDAQIKKYAFSKSIINSSTNVHGEKQHQLDIMAHDIFLNTLKDGRVCSYLISEEHKEILELDPIPNQSIFTVCIDPLDGSSNIDVNVSVGSIFSIYVQDKPASKNSLSLKSGRNQCCGGYLIYGPVTMFIFTYGKQVFGFTLNSELGEFVLTHDNIKLSKEGYTYSVNEGNLNEFPGQVKEYLKFCKHHDQENMLPYKSRYIGSMVADIHRTLFHGGIFLYPSTALFPNGKLRLIYECNPIAFIIERAGGLAIDGMRPVLDIPIMSSHQKVPFIAGSYNMVKKVLHLYKNASIDNHLFYSC
ncbi:class 1 fructose-1,6-bisphosphatase [Sphingobacterium sp. SGL-16]|uniref:class 1 fructose-bisphosphatase n=1 Tax=Sphingobacterium sp. SGL-16 TaxID=2710883 RepID=UPI0013EC66A4|nr:class 1 fructose-bisphosphatase [Sphingobacterium sp. SGL-16]NGM73508.1 fructose-1,6-bisphosphatase [Sphingobacterium sp. SGL-16]